jgi:hypothetical protein
MVSQFLTRGLLNLMSEKDGELELGLMFSYVLKELSPSVFELLQSKCFMTVSQYRQVGEKQIPMPLLMQDGTGRFTGGEPDLVTGTALLIAVLTFNLKPFFGPGALTTMRSLLPSLDKALSSPTSTASSGVQS